MKSADMVEQTANWHGLMHWKDFQDSPADEQAYSGGQGRSWRLYQESGKWVSCVLLVFVKGAVADARDGHPCTIFNRSSEKFSRYLDCDQNIV